MLKKIIKRIKTYLRNKDEDKLQSKFTGVFNNNLFHGKESVSGTGSDLIQTQLIRTRIPQLLEKFNVKTLIDAPCGDFYWMQHVDLKNFYYIGLDIVAEIIKKNSAQYNDINRKFICKNIISDKLPDGDLILIRDCLVHLKNEDIFKCINNLRQNNIKYLLTTSFTDLKSNEELSTIWRPINLELPPFNFPKPLEIINEGCTENEGRYSDKSLTLWEISKLPNIA